MARKQKLGPFHWHEALDRSFLAFEFFTEYVESHSAIQQTPALRKAAAEVAQRLADLYQAVGTNLPDEPKKKSR